MQPLTPDDVRRALHAVDPSIELLHFEESTATSELAAAAIGCEVAQIAKSICLLVNGTPVLVVMSGTRQVDDKKVAALYEVGRKKVKMAKADECIEIFGYPPGGVPPVGHRTEGITIYLDESLHHFERIYAAAGSASVNFGVSPHQLETITGGQWIDLAKD
ncbi:MAG: YbaK/EbsC family protein [Anaerolineae bacterium]|nr:YbaK/EbsC family protein [Anaerolineae bacterium]